MEAARRRLRLLGFALAVLALPAPSLRATGPPPAPATLYCMDEPASDDTLPAADAAKPSARAAPQSTALKSTSHERKSTTGICQRRNWLHEAASCLIREGPAKVVKKFGRFWADPTKRTCPLTEQSLAQAARPYGHEGARLRLRRAIDKLQRGKNITIAVLGTSFTVGTQSYRSWPTRLQDLFNSRGLKVTVTNLARGGSTSEWAVNYFSLLKEHLLEADIVIVDYGINDRQKLHRNGTAIGKIYRNLVKLLLALPNRPGVVDVQSFVDTPLVLARGEVPTNDCSAVHLNEYHHWPVNKDLQVPMLSYTEAVCHSNRTWWMMEPSSEDSQGSPHPGIITHDILARVVLGFFLDELDYVCENGVLGKDFEGSTQLQVGSSVSCLAQPTARLCAESGFHAVQQDPSVWSYGVDVKGKRVGWIARAWTKRGSIRFNVTTKVGWIQVEHLGTYENIGSVDIWLDDAAPSKANLCSITGLWSDRVSLSKFALLKTEALPGRHTLEIRSKGEKFKLLSITAC